jgi:hypothetical protein
MHAYIGVSCSGSLSTVAAVSIKLIHAEIYRNGCCAWDRVQEKLSKSTNNIRTPRSLWGKSRSVNY